MSGLLRAYVLDDEPLAVDRLCALLSDTGRVDVVGRSTRPSEAKELLESNPVDVLFLDVEMPGTSGLAFAAKLSPAPLIIFTTAHSQYAVKAFEVSAVDYLLKPVDARALQRALTKAERFLGSASSGPSEAFAATLRQLEARLAPRPDHVERLPSRVGGRVQLLDVTDITHFFAEDKLTYAALPPKSFIIDGTLSQLEQRLDPRRFFRIHRATLVNLAYVEELHGWFSGALRLKLKDGRGTELSVARDRVSALKDKLGI